MKRKIKLTSHKTMNFRFLSSVIVICCTYLTAVAASPIAGAILDSLPSHNPNYKGFRLAITNVVVVEHNAGIDIQFTAINTGREDLSLGDEKTNTSIVINIDEHSTNAPFETYQSSFKEKLLDTGLKIKAGEILYDQQLSINNDPGDPQPVVEQAPPPPTETGAVSTDVTSTEPMTQKEGSEINTNKNNDCSDLVIESVTIVKKSKNFVTLKYRIKNYGKQPALMTGLSKSQDDNLAMSFHMSSSEKLTRGSIPLGGTFIKESKQIPDGKLYPGKSLVDETKIDISNMTRFTPVIILQIDPYLSVQECNETNNLNHIKVRKE